MPKKNTMDDLRDHLFEQLERLKDAETEDELGREIRRAESVAKVSNQLIETAKVEVGLLRLVDDHGGDRPNKSRLLLMGGEQPGGRQDGERWDN